MTDLTGNKLRTSLLEQFDIQSQDLVQTGLAEGVFSEAQIIRTLTDDVLARALKISALKGKPIGLMTPSSNRHKKVKAINSNKIPPQVHDTSIFQPDNAGLWNKGCPWPNKPEWEYWILDGTPEVDADPEIRWKNGVSTQAWVQKYQQAGLDILSGADTYLTLMRQSLVIGTPIDRNTFTVINGETFTTETKLASGRMKSGQIILNIDYLDSTAPDLRLRAGFEVDVKSL